MYTRSQIGINNHIQTRISSFNFAWVKFAQSTFSLKIQLKHKLFTLPSQHCCYYAFSICQRVKGPKRDEEKATATTIHVPNRDKFWWYATAKLFPVSIRWVKITAKSCQKKSSDLIFFPHFILAAAGTNEFPELMKLPISFTQTTAAAAEKKKRFSKCVFMAD